MFLFVLPILLGVLAGSQAPDERDINPQQDKLEAARKLAMMTCNSHFDIDIKKVVESLSQFRIPNDPTFKCWYNCFMIQMGIKKDQRISWEVAKNITKAQLMDNQYDQKVDQLYANCEMEVPENFRDQCQLAYEFILCEARNWLRVGLPTH